ncbi:uncharacterized protein LOC135703529 [Ochlerotatus camptorhynchus]|uniref:uncharacterized protein LOC135703529 n=1 Tax=Ochlerotatus camptorhynchus TaxID=644619 RepID=UPI0031E3D44B
MARSFGVTLIVLVVCIGACKADFGMGVTVPNLQSSVSSAIGAGLIPLLAANASIKVNVDSDVTGTLGAVVVVVNSVNASVSRIYRVTKAAVSNSNTSSIVLFSGLLGNVTTATLDLVSAAIVSQAFPLTVDSETNTGIQGNITTLLNDVYELILVFSKFAIAVDQVQFSTNPVTSANVSSFVTPAIVSELTTTISSITSAVESLARLFTVVIRDKSTIVTQVRSINVTSSTANQALTSQINTYNLNIANASRAMTANINVWTSSIVQAVTPINDLLSTCNTFTPDSSILLRISETFLNLQMNVLQNLLSRTQTSADALYNATRAITCATISSSSQYAGTCFSKYSVQLTLPPVLVSRLSSCLSAETPTVLNLSPMLTPLLRQQRRDLTSVTAAQLSTCSKPNGPCVAVYATAFDELNTQISAQLNVTQVVLQMESEIVQKRFGTCANATTADVLDNIRIISSEFDKCLITGQ